MVDASVMVKGEVSIDLPPGFRFHPTDEEIITHYLSQKVLNNNFSSLAIGEVDLNKCEPWDLPSKAKMGEKEWYFFCHKDRKYPTGLRTNRATEAGYWKATGKDKEIYREIGILIGMKKTLVFYRGRAPKGEKTNWVMHEFRLEGTTPIQNLPIYSKDEWVVCRVFCKNMGAKKSPIPPGFAKMNSIDDLLEIPYLPALTDPLFINTNSKPSSSYINDDSDQVFDYKGIPASSTSMPSNYSTMMGVDNSQNNNNNNNNKSSMPIYFPNMNQQVSQSSMFNPQSPPPVPYSTLPGGSGNLDYLYQPQAMLTALAATTNYLSNVLRGHCKVEQLSIQSMVSASQDTCLSTDRNTEISSVVSKHEIGSFDELDDPSSARQVMDFANMWKY